MSRGSTQRKVDHSFDAAAMFMGCKGTVAEFSSQGEKTRPVPSGDRLVARHQSSPNDLKSLKEAQSRLCLSASAYHSQVAQGILMPPVKHGRQSLVLEREIVALQRAIARGAERSERQELVAQLLRDREL